MSLSLPIIEPSVFYSFPGTPLVPRALTELPPLSPKSTKSSQTTRDQRRDIRLLHDLGWSYKQIHDYLPFHPEYYQIRYAYRALQATLKKKSLRCSRRHIYCRNTINIAGTQYILQETQYCAILRFVWILISLSKYPDFDFIQYIL